MEEDVLYRTLEGYLVRCEAGNGAGSPDCSEPSLYLKGMLW